MEIDDDIAKPKTFYRSYKADDSLSPLSTKLRELILEQRPDHVLDFGCGSGKHLKMLPDTIVKCGLDISLINVLNTTVKNDCKFVILGDESHLGHLQYFDVVFTCSVLDHIEQVDRITNEFQRIARKAIFLAETNDQIGKFYFKHDYEALGFTKVAEIIEVTTKDSRKEVLPGLLDFSWIGHDGANYNIWQWKKQ